jgi:hypothetical protein
MTRCVDFSGILLVKARGNKCAQPFDCSSRRVRIWESFPKALLPKSRLGQVTNRKRMVVPQTLLKVSDQNPTKRTGGDYHLAHKDSGEMLTPFRRIRDQVTARWSNHCRSSEYLAVASFKLLYKSHQT